MIDRMRELIVRPATAEDALALAKLIDGFAAGHPAESHPRSLEQIHAAFFETEPIGRVLIAEMDSAAVGFGIWRRTYDLFWSMFGGDGLALYLDPAHRGSGAVLCIIAAMCAEIRRAGGHFLQTSYDPKLAGLYERVGVGHPERACHVSAVAFESLAGAAGKPAREIVRALPEKTLNYKPADH